MRQYSLLDRVIGQIDKGLATLFSDLQSQRDNPASIVADVELTPEETKQSTGFMRVNHSGEVCAQALYFGQLMFARDVKTREMLMQAAAEETDHLAWTHDRLKELNSHRSYFNIFWYTNAFVMGALASAAGDAWSLGFVEETERQVARHLEGHLQQLPPADLKSRAIVSQMKQDEEQHGQAAANIGAKPLPGLIQMLMRCHAKVMTAITYYC